MERMKKALGVLLVGAALAGCVDPYGRVDYGRTALLGIGTGAAAALTVGALTDKPRGYRRGGFGHRGHAGGYYGRDAYIGRAPGNYGDCTYYGGCGW